MFHFPPVNDPRPAGMSYWSSAIGNKKVNSGPDNLGWGAELLELSGLDVVFSHNSI